jgi:hypothetical protein
MFGWLKRRAQLAVISSFETDIDRFILGLRGASSSELGCIVALTSHWRNALAATFGWNLDHPDLVSVQDMGAAMKVNRMIRDVQQREPFYAPGLMVWLHSIRASQTPEIRLRGREMWSVLAGGIPFAEQAAEDLQVMGVHLFIDGFERIPQNLTPIAGRQQSDLHQAF